MEQKVSDTKILTTRENTGRKAQRDICTNHNLSPMLSHGILSIKISPFLALMNNNRNVVWQSNVTREARKFKNLFTCRTWNQQFSQRKKYFLPHRNSWKREDCFFLLFVATCVLRSRSFATKAASLRFFWVLSAPHCDFFLANTPNAQPFRDILSTAVSNRIIPFGTQSAQVRKVSFFSNGSEN